MKDRIEDFVEKNRAAFDDEVPGHGVWKNISNTLPRQRSRSMLWIWQAAAVLFFATSVYLFVGQYTPRQPAGDDSFSQVEDFYFREISQKRALIQDMSESGVSAEAELQKLDAMYLVLKEQFRDNPSEEVVEALTLNLIVRLDLLNQVVAEIEDGEAAAAEQDSSVEI